MAEFWRFWDMRLLGRALVLSYDFIAFESAGRAKRVRGGEGHDAGDKGSRSTEGSALRASVIGLLGRAVGVSNGLCIVEPIGC